MAKKKKAIKKTRTITDRVLVEGEFNLENLQGFIVNCEDEGLKDITKDLKELTGKYGKIAISIIDEYDVSDGNFSELDEVE